MHSAFAGVASSPEEAIDTSLFAQLPPELMNMIFEQLSSRDLFAAELCCRAWLQLLRSSQVQSSPSI